MKILYNKINIIVPKVLRLNDLDSLDVNNKFSKNKIIRWGLYNCCFLK